MLTCNRVNKPQNTGMEREAISGITNVSVILVSGNRMSQMCHLYADLVFSSCDQINFHKVCFRATFEYPHYAC